MNIISWWKLRYSSFLILRLYTPPSAWLLKYNLILLIKYNNNFNLDKLIDTGTGDCKFENNRN